MGVRSSCRTAGQMANRGFGTPQAAGTAVEMATGGPPTEHLTVRVDRPFLVVLSDGETDAPLFMAIVRDPR
jgi:serine protease inhibitor